MQEHVAVGVDIGGTKIAAAAVTSDGTVIERLRLDTPTVDADATEAALVAAVEALRSRHVVAAVGIGAAGFIDASRSVVLFAPHLAWRNEPLRTALEVRLGVPVVIENDANAAAWAEWRFGAARGERCVLCVNLGTGIGGGIVADGALWRGGWGMAGEFGHLPVVPDGRACECGNSGCWEQYASGNALMRAARELLAREPRRAQPLLDRAGGHAQAITGPVVTAAARDGDPDALGLFEEIGKWLGIGLAGLAAAFDPTLFVIGGGLSDAGKLLLRPARRAFSARLPGGGYRPEAPIVAARLGNQAGVIGAADLARTAMERRPS